MANSFKFRETSFRIGDTVNISYRLKEGDKERFQAFKGVLLKVKGDSEQNRMFTVRKITRSGIGVERIIPLLSPNVASMELVKKTTYQKAKAYFVKDLSETLMKAKLYSTRKIHQAAKKKAAKKASAASSSAAK